MGKRGDFMGKQIPIVYHWLSTPNGQKSPNGEKYNPFPIPKFVPLATEL
ncbi:hypothetical protein EI77_01455 [Prosthecobacter fusiformis]|uniref:Uncharacterized protein n=1 Tax=Prosthecobacter fusiformis TaxID=48464 RepID=A0A4R7S539_9BACT|nr:hypothetical protein EI77_01455 [Prosthecobacter fusiformis]